MEVLNIPREFVLYDMLLGLLHATAGKEVLLFHPQLVLVYYSGAKMANDDFNPIWGKTTVPSDLNHHLCRLRILYSVAAEIVKKNDFQLVNHSLVFLWLEVYIYTSKWSF